jgi:DUF2911 family protein
MLMTLAFWLAIAAGPTSVLPPRSLPACTIKYPDQLPAQGRKSPLDSLTFAIGKDMVKICYGRPSARGRTMIGGQAVPYDTLWRTGANEPTTVFSDVALDVAGVRAPAGSWTLYTVPGKTQWQVIVNASTTQWGIEKDYDAVVRTQEVGRSRVPSEVMTAYMETFTIHAEPAGPTEVTLVLEWEKTRVRIPIKIAK